MWKTLPVRGLVLFLIEDIDEQGFVLDMNGVDASLLMQH